MYSKLYVDLIINILCEYGIIFCIMKKRVYLCMLLDCLLVYIFLYDVLWIRILYFLVVIKKNRNYWSMMIEILKF